MATNFSGGIVASDGFKISVKNTPMDIRTRIESINEIESIPNPFIGMIFYVMGEEKFYVVKTLKDKKVGAMVITDALIDEYEPLNQGLITEERLQEELSNIGAIEGPMGPQGPQGEKGDDGTFDAETIFDVLNTQDKTVLGAINELLSMIREEHPGVPEGAKTYYGYIPVEVHNGLCASFNEIIPELIKNEDSVFEIVEPKALDKVSLGSVPENALIVVLVPKAAELRVFKDNGMGAKVNFDESIAGANGIFFEMDEIEYELYGEWSTVDGERLIYIIKK